jgi:hypothetical protein
MNGVHGFNAKRKPTALDRAILLRRAYVELLSINAREWKRRESAHGQQLLADLRDAVAGDLGLSTEQIQSDCEFSAFRLRNPRANYHKFDLERVKALEEGK